MQGTNMREKKARTIIKHYSKMFIGHICYVCVIAMLLASSMTQIAHAEHEHDNDIGCRVTRMPECLCDNNGESPRFGDRLYFQAGNNVEHQSHSEFETDCLICAVIYKTTNRLRQTLAAVGTVACEDTSLLSSNSMCLSFSRNTSPTPIELKAKLSN